MRTALILIISISTLICAQEILEDTVTSNVPAETIPVDTTTNLDAEDSTATDTPTNLGAEDSITADAPIDLATEDSVATDSTTNLITEDTFVVDSLETDTAAVITATDSLPGEFVEELTDSTITKIVQTDSISQPTAEQEAAAVELLEAPIAPLPMEMSYGYKGYRWGSPIGSVPQFAYAESIISQDSVKVILAARLGPDPVQITYHFADSGFWKVEIDFELVQTDIDDQIDQFLRIEKSMSEIYGYPSSTNQIYQGPSPSYNDILDVNFSRAFYRSGWQPLPVRIELLLSAVVQQSGSVLPIFEGEFSVLKLVYYNPDYMHFRPISERAEKIPSIFEIY